MWEQYHTPASLDEAVRLLSDHAPHARIIAGGTDLMLEMERGIRPGIKHIIDISRVPGLDRITEDDGWIRMGPLVTHNHCAVSPLIRERATTLAQACWEVGAPQIRNRGTVAGNLITASPANDSIPPLFALEAHIRLRSIRGERSLALADFYTGVRQTVMEEDEILTEIRFPYGAESRRSAFFKLGLRRAQAISVVNAAVVLDFEADRISAAKVTLGSVAPIIVHAIDSEAVLMGKALEPEVIEQAATLAMNSAHPIDDLRGSAAYRQQMVKMCVLRTLRDLLQGSETDRMPENPVTLWGDAGVVTGLDWSGMHNLDTPIETTINAKAYRVESGQDKSLLRFLREDVGMTGTKEGCAEGECGACTVFLDDAAVMACMVPAPRAHGADIQTIEGLAGEHGLHPVQQAFIEEGAVQCGYCTPGLIMSGVNLLKERAHPTPDEIAQALTGNLCRCTGYYKIIAAIEKAAVLASQ